VKAAADDDEEPDWVIQHQVEARVREFERAERELEERLQRVREREKEKEREAGGVRTVAGSRTSKKRVSLRNHARPGTLALVRNWS
jgi:chromosome transmission fidelity protein 1